MLGFAVGVIGMSICDFEACTPNEFSAICEAYHRKRETEEQSAWERMRMLACITIQPHVKKKLKPRDLLPLPWERHKTATASTMSKAEQLERMKRLLGER